MGQVEEIEQAANEVLTQRLNIGVAPPGLEEENAQLRDDIQKLLKLLNNFSTLSFVRAIESNKKALAEKEAAEALLAQLKDDSLSEKKYHLTIIETLRNVACAMALQYGMDVK